VRVGYLQTLLLPWKAVGPEGGQGGFAKILSIRGEV